jgi:hypothetical protein
MEVLTGYADAKGWVTAKAGRSDVHRAGNASAFFTVLLKAKVDHSFME